MKKVYSLIILSFVSLTSYSQNTTPPINSELRNQSKEELIITDSASIDVSKELKPESSDTGNLYIEKDTNFDLLLQEYLEQKKVSGYRIQLFAGNKRLDALKIKVDFMKLYPDLIPDIIYQQPNYKVRLGNFRNRLEATKELQLYRIDFPAAFIIKDHIKNVSSN